MFPSMFCCALFGFVNAVSAAPPSVTTKAGTLVGGQCNASSDAVFFKSIPYAQPPTGMLRFAPPHAYVGQYPGGTLNASTSARACIQFGKTFAETETASEDCLYLDVWSPASAKPGSNLPVRVWIYGGFNTDGGISNSLYDGCNVAASGVIHVSINYRVGPLGFLALSSAAIQGNQAIQDMLLGLQWVQDNIGPFGGDPKKVVLYGQSAGAIDAYALATLPQAPSLFSSAIFESGGGRDVVLPSIEQAVGRAYAQALNCSINDLSCLQRKPVHELTSAYQTLPIINSGLGHPSNGLGLNGPLVADFTLYLDGKIIPRQPSEVGTQVPSIFGFNSRDNALFVALAYSSPENITEADYTSFLVSNFGSPTANLIEQYLPFATFNASSAPGFAAISYVSTAWQYRCPAHRGLNAAAAHGVPAWAYNFSHTPSCSWLPTLPQEEVALLGPVHTAELPFVFGNTRGLPAPNGTCVFDEAEMRLSEFMVQAWNSMAAGRTPGVGNGTWPVWTGSEASLGLTLLNGTVRGKIDFEVCELFDRISAMQLANGTAEVK